MTCLTCGHETIVCLTPGGRVVDLEPEHIYTPPLESLRRMFILGAAGGGRGPAVAFATPVIELVDRPRYTRNGGWAGPFRREHACAA